LPKAADSRVPRTTSTDPTLPRYVPPVPPAPRYAPRTGSGNKGLGYDECIPTSLKATGPTIDLTSTSLIELDDLEGSHEMQERTGPGIVSRNPFRQGHTSYASEEIMKDAEDDGVEASNVELVGDEAEK